MNQPPPVTNSDAGVTIGSRLTGVVRRVVCWPTRRALLIFWILGVLTQALVNVMSVASDLSRRGIAFWPAEPWIWELSSALGLIIWLLPLLIADDALRARTSNMAMRLVLLLPMSLAFSAAHVVTMVAMRHLAYRLAGWQYDLGPWPEGFVYEYRKDLMTFALMLGVAAAWRAWATRQATTRLPAQPIAAAKSAPTFLVRTAQGELLVRADDIDWIEAQGNYVGLHVRGQLHLLRQTMADTEVRLREHGFIRSHRRAIVNRCRIQAIVPGVLGEAGVRLSSGELAPLSESRRAEVLRLVLGDD